MNTLNMYVMPKLFPLDQFEVKDSLKSQIFHSKIDLEISDKRVTFQGIFELQTNLEEKVLTSHTCLSDCIPLCKRFLLFNARHKLRANILCT